MQQKLKSKKNMDIIKLKISALGWIRKTILTLVYLCVVAKEYVTPCCEWVVPYIMGIL